MKESASNQPTGQSHLLTNSQSGHSVSFVNFEEGLPRRCLDLGCGVGVFLYKTWTVDRVTLIRRAHGCWML